MDRRTFSYFVSFALLVGGIACGSDDSATSTPPPPAGKGGAAGSSGSQSSGSGGLSGAGGASGKAGTGGSSPPVSTTPGSLPTKLSGFLACDEGWCAEIARACDDLVRSGCGADISKNDPGIGQGDSTFRLLLDSCIGGALEEMEADEEGERKDGGDEKEEEAKMTVRSLLLSQCTRSAISCTEMQSCFRGATLFPPAARYVLETATPHPFTPPKPPPTWTIPYANEGEDPTVTGTPWGAPVVLEGLDVPACAKCAVNRCPTFAYYCYGAAADPADCPNGDCCQTLRRCVRDCGGFDKYVTIEQHDMCMDKCAASRPKGIQQLVDLQNCGNKACTGCEDPSIGWSAK